MIRRAETLNWCTKWRTRIVRILANPDGRNGKSSLICKTLIVSGRGRQKVRCVADISDWVDHGTARHGTCARNCRQSCKLLCRVDLHCTWHKRFGGTVELEKARRYMELRNGFMLYEGNHLCLKLWNRGDYDRKWMWYGEMCCGVWTVELWGCTGEGRDIVITQTLRSCRHWDHRDIVKIQTLRSCRHWGHTVIGIIQILRSYRY